MAAYLTAGEAAAHLKFPTLGAFRAFCYRRRKAGYPVKTYRRNRTVLFLVADLDAALTVEEPRKLRRVPA